MDATKRALVAASVAGLLAAGLSGFAAPAQAEGEAESGGKAPCYGINKCKGTGACGGVGHSCHAQNACKGQGYLELEKDTCLKIEGGRLTAEPEAS